MDKAMHLNGLGEQLRKKYELISKKSRNCIVVCGPSGVGKTMAINHMVNAYGYKSIPFITTRELRHEELETDSKSVGYHRFMSMRLRNEVFLFAQNYGNSYGYGIENVFTELVKGEIVILETPAAQLLTDVRILLPHALVLGFVTFDHSLSVKSLNRRDNAVGIVAKLRGLQCSIESFNVQAACERMVINVITPKYGKPQRTVDQIDAAIKSHNAFNT